MGEELEAARELASKAISWLCVGMTNELCKQALANIMGWEKTDISEYTLEDCETLIQIIERKERQCL